MLVVATNLTEAGATRTIPNVERGQLFLAIFSGRLRDDDTVEESSVFVEVPKTGNTGAVASTLWRKNSTTTFSCGVQFLYNGTQWQLRQFGYNLSSNNNRSGSSIEITALYKSQAIDLSGGGNLLTVHIFYGVVFIFKGRSIFETKSMRSKVATS